MSTKIRGVNLGNWLVLERWMEPELFRETDAEDETWLRRLLPEFTEGAQQMPLPLLDDQPPGGGEQKGVFRDEAEKGGVRILKGAKSVKLRKRKGQHIYFIVSARKKSRQFD